MKRLHLFVAAMGVLIVGCQSADTKPIESEPKARTPGPIERPFWISGRHGEGDPIIVTPIHREPRETAGNPDPDPKHE